MSHYTLYIYGTIPVGLRWVFHELQLETHCIHIAVPCVYILLQYYLPFMKVAVY